MPEAWQNMANQRIETTYFFPSVSLFGLFLRSYADSLSLPHSHCKPLLRATDQIPPSDHGVPRGATTAMGSLAGSGGTFGITGETGGSNSSRRLQNGAVDGPVDVCAEVPPGRSKLWKDPQESEAKIGPNWT